MLQEIVGPERPFLWWLVFTPIAIPAFICSVAATAACMKVARRLGIVDRPDDAVKTHRQPTPYLGGIGILSGLLAGMLATVFFSPGDHACALPVRQLIGILAAGAVACIVGCVDDIFDVRPWQKVLGQTAAALILVVVGVVPELAVPGGQLPGPIEVIAQAAIVIVFVLGATNSLNLLDGLDGLCGGVTVIMTTFMLLLAGLLGTFSSGWGSCAAVLLCLGLLPAVMGFLLFNFPRRGGAKIFMGDAGSLLLGLNMAALMILFSQGGLKWWAAAVLIFGLPILDTATAFARRIINKRPLFVSDRGHIYDQMMDRGMSLKQAVIFNYVLTGLYGLAAIAISCFQTAAAVVACIAVGAGSLFVVWKKGFLKMSGLRGASLNNKLDQERA